MASEDLESVDPFHRLVLLAVVELRRRDDTPLHSFDVSGVCGDLCEEHDELEAVAPGGVTRQRVIQALSELEDEGHLEKTTKRSPTGKGRPAYSLDVDEAAVMDALAADDRFEPVVRQFRERRA